jgi:hypothetical protein
MENFYQPIEKLLAKHEYVVVPELGGFVVQLQSSQILSDQITPPFAIVGFNPLMHHSDGLLAMEIARSEKLSYRLAMECIEKEVGNIKEKLSSTGKVQIGNLGILMQNEAGTLLFSPNEKTDFLPQNFGLTNLYISSKDKYSNNGNKKITILFPVAKIFKYAAAAMIVFGLFFISPRVSDVRQTDYAGLAFLAFENEYQNASPTETYTKATEPVREAVAAVPDVSRNFHVIVACLSTQKSAEEFCKELIDDNFKEAHILPPIVTYRVAIQSFSDKEQAIRYMTNLRKTDSRFETAWVLCNK